MPVPFTDLDPAKEQQLWSQLNAWAQRRNNYQSTASAAQAAATGRVYKAQPDIRPGVALAAGQAIAANPNVEQSLTTSIQSARGQAIRNDLQAAAAFDGSRNGGADTPNMTQEQIQAEAKQLGVAPTPKPQSKGFADYFSNPFSDLDITDPTTYLSPLIGTASDAVAPVGYAIDKTGPVASALKTGVNAGITMAQGGVEMVQTRAAQGVHALGDIASSLKEGDLSGAGKAFLKAEATVSPFSAASLASAPEAAHEAVQSLKTTTAAQVLTKGLSTGEGFVPNPSAPAGRYQAAAARHVRGVIPGTNNAWTVGRQLASFVSQPGTKPYEILSGLADAGVTWYSDPFNQVAHQIRAARIDAKTFVAHPNAVDAVAKADELKQLGPVTHAEAGLIDDGVRKSIVPMRSDMFLASKKGRKLSEMVAADTDARSIFNAFDRKLSPATVFALQQADTPEKVATILRDELGLSIRSTDQIPALSRTYGVTHAIKSSPFGIGFDEQGLKGRQLSPMPRGRIDFSMGASDATRTASLATIDDAMSLAKVDGVTRARIFDNVVEATSGGNRSDMVKVANAVNGALAEVMKAHGVHPELADKLAQWASDDRVSLFHTDSLARPTDAGFLAHVADDGTVALDDITAAGPHLYSEGFQGIWNLPDMREVRRLTSPLSKVLAVQGKTEFLAGKERVGQLRIPFATMEALQNKVWKPLTIARVATGIRIVAEEQIRMAARGFSSAFHHPLDYMLTASGRRAGVSALGLDFSETAAHGMMDEYMDALNSGFSNELRDPFIVDKHSFTTGDWAPIDRATNPDKYVQGLQDEWRQLATDPIAKHMMNGNTIDDTMSWLRSGDPEANKVMNDLTARGERGFAVQGQPGVREYRDFNDNNVLRTWLERTQSRIDTKTGMDPTVLRALGRNVIGDADHIVKNADVAVVKAGYSSPVDMSDYLGRHDTWMGSTVAWTDEEGMKHLGTVVERRPNGESVVSAGGMAWKEGKPTKDLERIANGFASSDKAPPAVKYRTRADAPDGMRRLAKGLGPQLNSVVDNLMGHIMTDPTNYGSRSPVFRQAYYEWMGDNAHLLARGEANRLLKNLEAGAKQQGLLGKVGEYVGGDQRLWRVIDAAGRADGTLTVEDLNQFAAGYALDETKKLLYDTSERSNLSDSLRVAVPFGEAWKEVLTRWAAQIKSNPYIVRRAAAVVQGARDAGFFRTDTNGDEVFSYPGSSLLGGALGLGVGFTGKVSGLNIAGNFLPAVGPVVQIPAWAVLQNRPSEDWIRGLLMPYGEPPNVVSTLIPDWIEKVGSAITSDPNGGGVFGNTYIEALAALKASGKYPNTPAGRDEMESDAKLRAQVLTVLRGVGQGVVPSAPKEEFSVATKQGDVLVQKLRDDYQKMYAADPQTAVQRFLDAYGEGPFVYAVAKTKAANGGLDASEAFGAWEREHGGLFKRYPDVAGYMADVGDDFSFEVYSRQLSTGKRVKLTDEQFLDAVDTTIARWKYNQLKAAVGSKPNAAQSEWLRGAKAALEQQYPGFARQPPVADLGTKIKQLQQAVADPSLDANNIAASTRSYLKIRDAALAEAKKRGAASLAGDKMADLRQWLDGAGQAVAADNPQFSRVWDSLLSHEVETGTTNGTAG